MIILTVCHSDSMVDTSHNTIFLFFCEYANELMTNIGSLYKSPIFYGHQSIKRLSISGHLHCYSFLFPAETMANAAALANRNLLMIYWWKYILTHAGRWQRSAKSYFIHSCARHKAIESQQTETDISLLRPRDRIEGRPQRHLALHLNYKFIQNCMRFSQMGTKMQMQRQKQNQIFHKSQCLSLSRLINFTIGSSTVEPLEAQIVNIYSLLPSYLTNSRCRCPSLPHWPCEMGEKIVLLKRKFHAY